MRQGLFMLAVLLFAAHAVAQDDEEKGDKKKKKEDPAAQDDDEKGDKKKKKGKDEEEDKAQGPSLDTGEDPSDVERTERGRHVVVVVEVVKANPKPVAQHPGADPV